MSDPVLRHARAEDAVRCHEIERAAYASDAAATLDKIARRIAIYPQGFLVAEREGRIEGFVNSACADGIDLGDEALKDLADHDPAGAEAVILSLAVDPDAQGTGLAGRLMRAFLTAMRQAGKSRVHLICRSHHIGLYERFGFVYLRPSASAHGGEAWHEMALQLSE